MLLIIHSSSLYKEMQRFYVFQLSNQFCNFRLQNCLMLPADKISSGNNVFPINCWGKPLNSKGLVQHLPRLYSGWGFLTSQCDRQLKFSAYASFMISWSLHEIISEAYAENLSCLSHWEVRNPHPLYNLCTCWTSPFAWQNSD